MSLRFADFQALLFAALVFGLLPAAKAQSAAGAQHIIFSSPDGRTASNAPIPMVQAPESGETPNLPAGDVTIHQFPEPMVAPEYPVPPPVLQQPNVQSQDDLRDPSAIRKEMGLLTPAQIMNIPTPEQIFGLPEKTPDAQNGLSPQTQNGATNSLAPDTTGILAEPGWAKIWTENPGETAQSSNTTDRASGFFSRFFDSTPGDNVFGNHGADADDVLTGDSQPAAQSSSWDSALTSGALTPASDAGSALSGFTAPGESSPQSTSLSPFAAPQVSTVDSLPKLPSLPSLPSIPGQSDKFTAPASAPSWAPKPPPWAQPQTPFGTPINQSLSH